MKFSAKTKNLRQKHKIFGKNIKFSTKKEIFGKKCNFRQKWKFWPNIEIVKTGWKLAGRSLYSCIVHLHFLEHELISRKQSKQ